MLKLTDGVVATALENLANKIATLAQHGGDYITEIPGLSLHRRDTVSERVPCIYSTGIGVVVQGGKQVILGNEVFDYNAGQSMLTAVDFPALASVTRASPAEPFLGLMLTFDPIGITQLAAGMGYAQAPRATTCHRALSIRQLDLPLLDALTRLVALLSEPSLAPHVAPLIKDEIAMRLLAGAHGPLLQRLVAVGSPSGKIAKALVWLKQNFAQSMNVNDLAVDCGMSPSTFRQHFRALTGVSPVQYQKQLRLQHARQLMLTKDIDASSAGLSVGYESASQFSREYARLFGAPPLRDMQRMRVDPEDQLAQILV